MRAIHIYLEDIFGLDILREPGALHKLQALLTYPSVIGCALGASCIEGKFWLFRFCKMKVCVFCFQIPFLGDGGGLMV